VHDACFLAFMPLQNVTCLFPHHSRCSTAAARGCMARHRQQRQAQAGTGTGRQAEEPDAGRRRQAQACAARNTQELAGTCRGHWCMNCVLEQAMPMHSSVEPCRTRAACLFACSFAR
jgi:hypothetical protein